MRSKRTARSKGYCFVEFREPEVAKIAAESMDGYLMYGRPIVCRYIDPQNRNKFQLVRCHRKFKFVPWQVIYKKAMNAEDKTDEQIKKSLVNLLRGDEKKAERLKELGIDFEFPQYKDLMEGKRVFVIGVGMTKFIRPGKPGNPDYHEMAKQAGQRALHDAGISYRDIEQVSCSYVYGDSCCGQRALYEIGMSGVPVFNVNNNCSSGSTGLYIGYNLIKGGVHQCVMALGFEKMEKGSLKSHFGDRENPLQKFTDTIKDHGEYKENFPFAPMYFGNAGMEHMKVHGTKPEHFAKIAEKNHKHSANNPYSQFRDVYTLDQISNSPKVFGPLTKLQCCPTSDGAGCVILASERYVKENHLEDQAVEILGMVLESDNQNTFEQKSLMNLVGYEMTDRASQKLYDMTRTDPSQVQVCELHDCFSTNELLTYEGLGLCPKGKAGPWIDNNQNTYGGQVVVNPSGGLISKGHPLGATGLAQCSELVWQLRGMAGARQVKNCRLALQHNLGLGGAVVVALYQKYNENPSRRTDQSSDPDVLEKMEKNNQLYPQKNVEVPNLGTIYRQRL